MQRHVSDEYVKKAKMQKYRSRAAFKLIELNERFNLFKPGMRVIDVGSTPGGWCQVIADRVDSPSRKPTVVGADLIKMQPVEGVGFVQGDITKNEIQEKISEMLDFQKAHVVTSDAVPDFMGDRFVDHMKAVRLNEEVIQFCRKNLMPGGNLLMKIIRGPAE